jgi:hypothetical protein
VIITVVKLNSGSSEGMSESEVGTYNVILVVGGALAARIYVQFILDYVKEVNSWEMKVLRGTVESRMNGKAKIGNLTLKFDRNEYSKISTGEKVEVHLSVKTNTVLAVRKI